MLMIVGINGAIYCERFTSMATVPSGFSLECLL